MESWHLNKNHRKFPIKNERSWTFLFDFLKISSHYIFDCLKTKVEASILQILFVTGKLFPGSMRDLTFPKPGLKPGTALYEYIHETLSTNTRQTAAGDTFTSFAIPHTILW